MWYNKTCTSKDTDMNEETFTPFYISNAYFLIIADVLSFPIFTKL